MLSPFKFIQESQAFPLDKIVAVLDWKRNMYKSNKEEITKLNQKYPELIPVFLINNCYYVPKQFNKVGEPAYPGMTETNLEVFQNLSGIKYTTTPLLTETIDEYEYGLIKWYENSYTLFEKRNKIDLIDIKQIIECGLELGKQGVFHLDLNHDNIIKTDRIYFVDPSLAKPHFRPEHNYFDERTISYHWSPEILNGGYITEKSSIYSIGKTIRFCNKNVNNNLTTLINSFIEKNPDDRPSFNEAYKKVKELV